MQKNESFRIQNLENIFINLTNNKSNITPVVLKQQLNSISRILIWDDQQANSDFFDYVLEVKMLDLLLDIFSKNRDKDIINSILGFFNMLLTNISKQQTLNYLLSHPCVISIELTKFGNMNNQIADYYINFLKGLSRKMNQFTFNLFFNIKYPNFPLLMQTIRFFNHPESLVRTTCRNIVLTISKVKNQRIQKFMAGFPFCYYYIHQCNFIKQYWTIIDDIIDSDQDKRYEIDNLDTLIQDHEEVLFFIDDFLKMHENNQFFNEKQTNITHRFVDAFMNQCLSPFVKSLDSQNKQYFSIKVILFMLSVLFKNMSSQFFIEMLTIVVFGRYYTKSLTDCLYLPIQKLLSYDKKWKFKGFWDSHEDKINQYCIETYHDKSGQLKNRNQEIGFLDLSFTKKSLDTLSVFGVTNNFYERQIEKIQNIFEIPIISQKVKRKSGSRIIKQIKQIISGKNVLDLTECEINPIAQSIQSYLLSKDDTLMILTLNLLTTFFKNKSISNEILNFCKMSLKPKDKDFESIMKIQRIILACLELFEVDPPCFRICTYKQSEVLIKLLMPLYQQPDIKLSTQIIVSLKRGLKTAIDRINPYLYGGKQWEKSLQIYEQALKQNQKKRNKTLKTYGLIPDDEEQPNSKYNVSSSFQEFPKNFNDQIERDFWIYIIIKKLFLYTHKIHNITNIVFEDQKIISHSRYEIGKDYDPEKDEIIKGEYKQNNQQKYSPCQIILLSGYFIVGKNRRVELKFKYEDSMVLIDKSDPRKVFMKCESNSYSFNLFDSSVSISLRKHFQQSKSLILRYKLSLLIKQIQKFEQACL